MSQVVECATCGRAAVVVCGNCTKQPEEPFFDGLDKIDKIIDEANTPEPKRYTVAEVEEMILRWCGWPQRTIENVRHAFKMEATGGIDRGQQKPT